MPRDLRTKIVVAISSSNSRMAADRLGWAMNSDLAASVIDPFSATSMTYLSCCSVMRVPSPP